MNIVISEGAFDSDEKTLTNIDQIIARVEDEVHRLEIDGADKLKESSLYKNSRPIRQKFLMAVASRPPARGDSRELHQREVLVDSSEAAELAKRLVYSPLTILVEDREADGVLLEMVVDKLASAELKSLWRTALAAAPAGVEIMTSGGINAMPDRVVRLMQEPSREGCLRLIVFCDCDKRWPADRPESAVSIEALQALCAENNITCHVLEKRTAENYIPDEVFEAARELATGVTHKQQFDAFLRRSRDQRDHFPIKDGISDKEKADAVGAGLYDPADLEDLALLERRLFSKRPRLILQIQRDHLHHVTQAGLRARDGVGELDRLLGRIAFEL